jgi:hypothetical protein
MARFQLPIASNHLRSRPSSTARLLNCYAEALPQDAKSPVLLTRVAGVADWAEVGNGVIHALFSAMGSLFAISGTKLYEIDENGTETELGDIGTISTNLDIDSNGSALVVVNQPDAYYWDGATFGQITDADFTSRGAADVEFVDSWLLFREPDSGRMFGSDLGSATSFDALNFVTAEGFPDDLVGMKVDHRQVLLFGSETVELWENTGIAGFPFERSINGLIEIGCLNGRTIAKQDNSVFWLADDYTVRRLEGTTPQRVSSHAVEQSIVNATIAAGKAYAYSQDGHLFYVITFPEVTWVYDATTGEWHERQTYGQDFWVATSHAQAYGREFVGNSTTNQVGYLDPNTYTDWDETIRVSWTYQPVYAESNLAFHDKLEIVLETGVGLSTGQGSDPEIMLDYSNDGGQTWTALPNRSIGQVGRYDTRVIWSRLGSSRQRVYRAAISDPVKVNITDTQISVRGGTV